MRPDFDLEAVRREIPILRHRVPMNGCSQAPQCARTRAAAEAYLTSWADDGMDWPTWMAEAEAARAEFAALIGAEPHDVGIATSVSQATSSLASGLDYSGSRTRVVVSGVEFPTVAHVWRAQERFGAKVVTAPVGSEGSIPLEAYGEAVDDRTLIVSAALAYYQNGWTQNISTLAELVHARGALLYVDAYQALGSGPFDAPSSGADVVASGALKFLMGIPGIAFIWVRPGLAESLHPALTGWFGRREPFAFDPHLDWADGARRLDTGTPPVFEAYVARAGMSWLRSIGLEAIGAWNRALGARAIERGRERGLSILGPTDPLTKTPTTAFACADSYGAEAALRTRGIIAAARGPALRIAPHFFNTLDEVDLAVDTLAEVLGV